MPSIIARNGDMDRIGANISVIVRPPSYVCENLVKEGKAIPFKEIALQIDTGASSCCVQSGISRELGLVPHDIQKIITPSGEGECKVFQVRLVFPQNGFEIDTQIIETDFSKQTIDGLLGRDVLKNFVFIYHGFDSSFTLCF